jgi:START domain-containing protein
MKKKFFISSLLLFGLSTVMAQGKWELKKNENGIEVFTRKAAKGNIKELRVICELDATKVQLINTLEDISDYNSWVYSNKKSTVLKTITPQNIIYYTESHLPWPIKDRDLVIELNITPTPDVLNIVAKSLPAYLPQNNNYIRVPYSLAQWKVTQAPDNKLKVDYTFSVDPGGNIPSWLVNATLTIGPYNSFLKLKEILKAQKQPEIKAEN